MVVKSKLCCFKTLTP